MAVEMKRGCGYRKVGGIYLVGERGGVACDRLPLELHVCPTCSQGIKQSRGWTWVEPKTLFSGDHVIMPMNPERWETGSPCQEETCPVCRPEMFKGRAGLLWIGEKFYKTAEAFDFESNTLGISRRIKQVPREFKLGETWVLLGHPKVVRVEVEPTKFEFHAGIFRVFKPVRIEKLITESQSKILEVVEELEKKGITPVVVPDDDPDHQGTVYDKEEAEQE